jgi:hypothetical protein
MSFRLQRTASKSYVALITVQYMCINTYSQRDLSAAALKFVFFVCCSYNIADVLGIYCLSPCHYANICQSSLLYILYQLFTDFPNNLEVNNL